MQSFHVCVIMYMRFLLCCVLVYLKSNRGGNLSGSVVTSYAHVTYTPVYVTYKYMLLGGAQSFFGIGGEFYCLTSVVCICILHKANNRCCNTSKVVIVCAVNNYIVPL